MNEKLYKLYREDFTSNVNGLEIHNVKLNDLRLKRICKKWDINIRDGNNVIYYGTNKYGTVVLGVILLDDVEQEFVRFIHVLSTKAQISDFLSKAIIYLEILKQAKTIFIVDRNYNGGELDYNIITFEELPKEFRPLKNSYCP